MAVKEDIEEYSEAELRKALLRKHQSTRHERLERYYRTGRAIRLLPDHEPSSLSDFHSGPILDAELETGEQIQRGIKKTFDNVVLVVEIGAIIAFLAILLGGITMLRSANRDTAIALALPTLTPTPLIKTLVLPSGHTPGVPSSNERPAKADIPGHLQPLVQSYGEIPIPTPVHEHASRIKIPAIGIDAPIVQGTEWEQLKKGVGQVIGTANPGEKGNLVLSAHNDIFGEIFRYLDRLNPGDQFTVYTNLRSYTYEGSGWEIVEPTKVEVMAPTPNPTATLISCYPYLIDKQRIVVKAELIEG